MQKKRLGSNFYDLMQMKMIQKSLKTWCLLNANIKTNQEVKTRILNF